MKLTAQFRLGPGVAGYGRASPLEGRHSVLLATLIGVVLLLIWALVLVDVVRRPDLRTSSKVLWALLVLVVPFIGALIYLIARPAQPSDHELVAETREGDAPMEPMRHGPA
jgi:uncharacterized membrane protein YhaH (DUF805 family)